MSQYGTTLKVWNTRATLCCTAARNDSALAAASTLAVVVAVVVAVASETTASHSASSDKVCNAASKSLCCRCTPWLVMWIHLLDQSLAL